MEENPGVVTSSSLRGEIAQSIMDSLRVLLRRTNSSEGQCGLGLVGRRGGQCPSIEQTGQSIWGQSQGESPGHMRTAMRISLLSDGKGVTFSAGGPGSTPGLGRSPGGGHGNPLQYSCLENSTDRGAWRATVHGVAKSQT